MRPLFINAMALLFGSMMAVIYLSQYSSAQTEKQRHKNSQEEAITTENNDYQFRTQKDFKDHSILDKKPPKMQSFDAKPITLEDNKLQMKINDFKRKEQQQRDQEEEQQQHEADNVYSSYMNYVKKKSALKHEVEEDLQDELDDLTPDKEDYESRSLD